LNEELTGGEVEDFIGSFFDVAKKLSISNEVARITYADSVINLAEGEENCPHVLHRCALIVSNYTNSEP